MKKRGFTLVELLVVIVILAVVVVSGIQAVRKLRSPRESNQPVPVAQSSLPAADLAAGREEIPIPAGAKVVSGFKEGGIVYLTLELEGADSKTSAFWGIQDGRFAISFGYEPPPSAEADN